MRTAAAFLLFVLPGLSGIDAMEELRRTIDLNGTWDFEQTETAFPPKEFTRTIPVPGLVHLAEPKIEQFDKLLTKEYEPRYNWYRRRFGVPAGLEGTQAVLSILKSKYVTHVYVNGMEMGNSMACYTPVEFPVTGAIRFGGENEVLIRVGDRAWLPSAAAGGTDKEKISYLPGIWDDVCISFTGRLRAQRVLVLPSVSEKKVTAKVLVRSFYPAQIEYGDRMNDSCEVKVAIREANSGKAAGSSTIGNATVKRDNLTELSIEVPVERMHVWTPEDPFLYTAEVTLREKGVLSDQTVVRFGMRDFQRQGKHFALNGKRILLRGTNITLHRFFEDPECEGLPWDREWVRKLLSDIPKALDWNAMRICVGIAPKFWYDIADESGLLLQNEWIYWQTHGWDEQIRAEYTDWVWSDGNHPSIAIWDAINENWDAFIGNELIPELKRLDSTRIWDAGYMTSEHMAADEMDEPHPYRVGGWRADFEEYFSRNPYSLGDLHDWSGGWEKTLYSSSAQLVNEYGWIWLWRDGRVAKLTEKNYAFYLGEDASPKERRELQAYWLQLQTEWLRTERSLAGVLSFCYLANNYGFTGDWFIGAIRDLQPGPTLAWFRHCFAPSAVFIDLVDERYTKHVPPHTPGSKLSFNLVGVNDHDRLVKGIVTVRLLNWAGKEVARVVESVSIPPYGKQYIPTGIRLPEESGGYLVLAEYAPENSKSPPVLSRRTIKVGEKERYAYFDYELKPLEY
jgi:beta-galactosidase